MCEGYAASAAREAAEQRHAQLAEEISWRHQTKFDVGREHNLWLLLEK
jgi:hypothetical protein